MAFSTITISFVDVASNPPIDSIEFQINGINKPESGVLLRTGPGTFTVNTVNDNIQASNYRAAIQADYSAGLFNAVQIGPNIVITALADGAVFSDFDTSHPLVVSAVIDNVAFDPEFTLTDAELSEADTNPCTTVKVTLSQVDGTPPFTWVSPLPGNIGLEGTVPRSGGDITITVEDDNEVQSSILVPIPVSLDNSAIDSIVIEGDPSGLYGSVSVLMNTFSGVEITYEYSMDGVNFQTSNVFTSVLPGLYTMYIRDNFGCTISEEFEVSLSGIRPPSYSLIPNSNSFGWFQQQTAVNDCTNPYNGTNAKPNDYKPTRWHNPKYFQPWCPIDNPLTQFRSNYDTLVAKLINILTDAEVATLPITKKSNNIGQRQIMDAKIYDRGSGQTGIYFDSGNIYDTDGVTVIDTHSLAGQLPEWARVGQKFFLSDSAADGLFEIQQIIYDSELLVNAIVINRVYTDLSEPIAAKVDATYNRLNYETYEFFTDLSAVPEGCYKVTLSMTDSLEEYQDSLWETFPFKVTSANKDIIYIESSDHIDDGILYSTGIIHKQRFTGLFYEEDYPSSFEVHKDSRKEVNKLDGRVEQVMILEAIDVPFWVHKKLALFISKKNIRVNNLQVQFIEEFEREKSPTYSRVNLKAEAIVKGFEQYMTNTYDIL